MVCWRSRQKKNTVALTNLRREICKIATFSTECRETENEIDWKKVHFPLKCSFHLTCTQKLVVFVYSHSVWSEDITSCELSWVASRFLLYFFFLFLTMLIYKFHEFYYECFCNEYINFVFSHLQSKRETTTINSLSQQMMREIEKNYKCSQN